MPLDSENKNWSPREFVEKVSDSRFTSSLSRIQGNLCYLYIRQEGKSGNTAAFDFLWELFMEFLTKTQENDGVTKDTFKNYISNHVLHEISPRATVDVLASIIGYEG